MIVLMLKLMEISLFLKFMKNSMKHKCMKNNFLYLSMQNHTGLSRTLSRKILDLPSDFMSLKHTDLYISTFLSYCSRYWVIQATLIKNAVAFIFKTSSLASITFTRALLGA